LANEEIMNRSMLSRVQTYLAERRALGFQLKQQGNLLLNFARYADSHRRRGPLTRRLAIQWACLPKQVQRAYWAHRLAIVRVFAQYLCLTEPGTQLPPRHLFGSAYGRNPPHLYTPEQIAHILRRARELTGRLRPHTFQTMVGLLACTGLRISEALHLKVGDVDWEQSALIVRQSKYGKSRMVPLHRTAIPPLRAYARRRQNLFPLADYFFVSERGHRLALSTADHLFISLRKGIPSGRRPPRLHDFRHTVACRVLQRWETGKRGALDRLAILSRYLGHTQVTDTYWYFSLFPQLAAEIVRHRGSHQ
jgi:integrase